MTMVSLHLSIPSELCSFTQSLLNISWCLQYFRQWCFSFLDFLRNVDPCTATGLIFLSWEPETASWRILATGGEWVSLAQPPYFHWYPQAKTIATCFSINIYKIEERHFFIPEKHSKAFHLPRTSQMEATCGSDPTDPLLPPLSTFHMWLPEDHVFWFFLYLVCCSFSGFCEAFSSSCWRAPGFSPLSFLFFPNYTHSLGNLLQTPAFKYHLYANNTTFLSPSQIQASASNCVTNIATLMFNRYIKLNSPTETPDLSWQTCFAYRFLHFGGWQLQFSSCSGQLTWSHPWYLSFSNSHLIHWLDFDIIQNLSSYNSTTSIVSQITIISLLVCCNTS